MLVLMLQGGKNVFLSFCAMRGNKLVSKIPKFVFGPPGPPRRALPLHPTEAQVAPGPWPFGPNTPQALFAIPMPEYSFEGQSSSVWRQASCQLYRGHRSVSHQRSVIQCVETGILSALQRPQVSIPSEVSHSVCGDRYLVSFIEATGQYSIRGQSFSVWRQASCQLYTGHRSVSYQRLGG